jgi:predicted dehydrogenase
MVNSGWDVPAEAWSWRRRGPWAERFAAPSLFDDSAHLVSPAVALFGDVARAVALTGNHRIDGRATGFPYAISWHHSDGGQAVVEGTLCEELTILTDQYSADTSITITGSAGILWINTGEGRAAARPTIEIAAGGRLTSVDVDHRWSAAWHVAQAEWVTALRDGTDYRWTGDDALRVLACSLLVDDAIRTAQAAEAPHAT